MQALVEVSPGKYAWVPVRGTNDDALCVAEQGIVSQRHNRFISGVTATWPGDDSFSVLFTQLQNVRRYRVLVIGGAAGDFVKVSEDAVNEAQEEAWLTEPTSNSYSDVEHFRVYAVPQGVVVDDSNWSEWMELSKNPKDISLSRLGFLASSAGPFDIFVEAE